MLQKVWLAHRHTRIAENRVCSRDVEKEVGKRKARQISAACEAIAGPVREFDDNFAIFAFR